MIPVAGFPGRVRWETPWDGRDDALRQRTRQPAGASGRPVAIATPAGLGCGRGDRRLCRHDDPPGGARSPADPNAPRRGGGPMGSHARPLVLRPANADVRRADRLGVEARRHPHGDRHRGRGRPHPVDRPPLGADRVPGRSARDRGDDVRDDHVRRRPRAPRGAPPRPRSAHLELPVRTRGGRDRPVRGPGPHHDVAGSEHHRPVDRVDPRRRPADRGCALAAVPRDAPPDRRDRQHHRRRRMSGVRAPRHPHRRRGGRVEPRGRRGRSSHRPGRVPVAVPADAMDVRSAR